VQIVLLKIHNSLSARNPDVRVPDIVVIPNLGTIYTESTSLGAQGGFSEEDTHVALLVSSPGLKARVIKTPVETTQIAPTILRALGLNPRLSEGSGKRGNNRFAGSVLKS